MWERRVGTRMNVIRHRVRWGAIWTRLALVRVRHKSRWRIIDGVVSFRCILGHSMNSGSGSGR